MHFMAANSETFMYEMMPLHEAAHHVYALLTPKQRTAWIYYIYREYHSSRALRKTVIRRDVETLLSMGAYRSLKGDWDGIANELFAWKIESLCRAMEIEITENELELFKSFGIFPYDFEPVRKLKTGPAIDIKNQEGD